jgi:hypothetical protein
MAFYMKANSRVTDVIREIAECYRQAAGFWKQYAARFKSDIQDGLRVAYHGGGNVMLISIF